MRILRRNTLKSLFNHIIFDVHIIASGYIILTLILNYMYNMLRDYSVCAAIIHIEKYGPTFFGQMLKYCN